MYKIIPQVLEAIIEALGEKYLQFPTAEQFITISNNMYHHWQMPNCVGAIDGKHMRTKAPAHSGSLYHNYKGYFSYILMAASDAFHRFTWVEVGDYGNKQN